MPFTSSFLGRSRDLAQLIELLASGERLITVRGTAGVGKTRLARELCRQLEMPSIVVELGAANDGGSVLAELGGTLGLASSASDVAPQIGRALARRELLLVLDEVERHTKLLSTWVPTWLADAPRVRILLTSRLRLGLASERVVPLEPLDLADATALLTERAHRLGAPVSDGSVVAELARRVGGVPLALELAASWVALLGASTAIERMDLNAPDQTIDLQASIDASVQLLSPDERTALVALTTLGGSFDLPTAEAVVGGPALLVLRRLHEASILHPVPTEPPRFELYSHVREVVSAAHEDRAARERRDAYFAQVAEEIAAAVVGRGAETAMVRFRRELHHLLSVARTGRTELAVRVARAIATAALPAGSLRAVDAALETLLARDLDPRDEAILRAGRARILRRLSRFEEAAIEAARAVAQAERSSSPVVLATSLQAEGAALTSLGRHRAAVSALTRASSFAPEHDLGLRGEVRSALGAALASGPRPQEAEEHLVAAVELLERAGRSRALAIATLALAKFLIDHGRTSEAGERFAAALSLGGERSDRYVEAMAWIGLAYVAHLGGDPHGADDGFQRALRIFDDTGLSWMAWVHRVYQAQVFASRGDVSAAAGLFAECIRAHGDHGSERYRALSEAGLAACLGAEDPQRAEELLAAAQQRAERLREPTLEELVSLHRAALLSAGGDHAAADAMLQRARSVVPMRSERTLVVDALARTHARGVGPEATVQVDRRGRWIVAPDGSTTALGHRATLQRLLHALLEARELRPGVPLDRVALRQAGWGDERMDELSASQRLRTALAALRRAGLKDALRTDPSGWFLDPRVPLAIRDRPKP